MKASTITVEICGMSGEGTISAGGILNSSAANSGYYVLAFDSYPAEIRGFGKCVAHSRFGGEPVLTQGDSVDILISLDDNYSREQLGLLQPGSAVIYDNRPPNLVEEDTPIIAHLDPEVFHYGVPFRELSQQAMSSDRGKNLVALGALTQLFEMDPEPFRDAIEKRYFKASDEVRAGNRRAFDLGRTYAEENIRKVDSLSFSGIEKKGKAAHIVSGQQAVAQACLDQNLKLYAGYPITPATPIMEILAKELPKKGGSVLQMEDEIASIGCVVGAGYAGVRACTATSGPGLSLMTELLNLAVMAEVPALIVNAQRGGPSTGLPTKTEQSDLNLCVFGGSGDSPRIVLAPINVEQSYKLTEDALWLAEKYQTPVILLYDFFLANRMESVPALKPRPERQDGNLFAGKGEGFVRYKVTDSGISPRSVPGMEGKGHPATGLEHDEGGRPNYTEETHLEMGQKRWRKIEGAGADLEPPVRFGLEGEADVAVITWGSTAGAAMEAVAQANSEGLKVSGMAVESLWPFPKEAVKAFLDDAGVALCPEGNLWGQFANLASAQTGRPIVSLPFPTGAPVPVRPIVEQIRAHAVKIAEEK